MKRYFTHLSNALITGKNHINRVKIFFLGILLCSMSNLASAAITVTPATGGTNICSNLAMNGSAPAWTTLGVITMTEGLPGDFGGAGGWNVFITINAPTGWSFNTTVAPIYGWTAGADISSPGGVTATAFTGNALTLRITGTGNTRMDAVTVTGLQVEANSVTSPAGNMYATIGFGTATGIVQGPSPTETNFGTLSQNPAPIAGASAVCVGNTMTVSDASAGGAWTSSNTTVATVSAGGVVSGIVAGVTNIDYTLTGCTTAYSVSVNAAPTAITGTAKVCSGFTTTLSDAITGGVWTSATTTVATVGAASGVVSGVPTVVATSTSVITYSVSACPAALVTYTVYPTPAAITGNTIVCVGATTNLSDNLAGGTWSSTNSTVATVVAGTGVVSGGSAGTAPISYTITATGCYTTTTVTVHAQPTAITGTTTMCSGAGTILSDAIAGGVWTSATTTVATVGSATGVVSGVPTVVVQSTSVISYSVAACPAAVMTVTVNPTPTAVIGNTLICVGATTTLSDAIAGGTWSSLNSTVATVGAGTSVVSGGSAGAAPIKYTITTSGCFTTTTVTVHAQPTAITGNPVVCSGVTTTLSNSVAGGVWTSATTTVATVGSASGVVSGVPTVVVTSTSIITYSVSACPAAVVTVTVNPTPAGITGPAVVCQNSTIALSDPTAGGAWSSSITTMATVAGGIVTGVGAGTPYISYTISGCFATHTVLVNPLPAAITGITSVCTGLTTNLSSAPGGGAWSSSTTTVATITGAAVVSGITPGTSVINYTLGTGCLRSTTVTVNQSPGPILGTPNACMGQSTTLSDGIAGGVWTSSTTTVATIGPANGFVTPVSPGITTITYKMPVTNCAVTAIITINAVPSAISGITTLCQGSLTSVSDTSPGGIWSSSNTSIATVSGTGLLSGVAGGTTDITYAFGASCFATATVTVNPLPVPGTITGSDSVCLGSVTTLSDASAGGLWSSSNTAIATVGSATGVVSGVTIGTANIIYTVSNGCGTLFTSISMTVDLLVPQVVISANPGLTSCIGIPDTFTATPINGGTAPTYQWKVNGTVVSTANPYTYTPANGDVVICTITSNAPCLSSTTAKDSVTLVINSILVPSVTISTGAYTDTVCTGMLTQFTATPVNGGPTPSYQWYVNGTLTGTTNPFNYTPINGDKISCRLTSSYGCASPASVMSNTVTMTVVSTESPTINITASANPSCKGYPVTFTAHTLYGGVTPFIRWTQNGINVATGPTYTIIPNNGDQFYCMLRSSNTCVISTLDSVFSNTIFITVDSPIVPIVSVVAAYTVITTSQYDTLTAIVGPVTITPTYQWYRNGVAIPGATSRIYVAHVSTTGIDYFYCIVGNGNACNTSTISNLLTITVNPSSGVNQVALGNDNLKLVPNPNAGEFTIQGTISSDDQDAMIEITNVVGQVVYKDIAPVKNEVLNKQITLGRELTNGVYLLNVITNKSHKVIRFTLSR